MVQTIATCCYCGSRAALVLSGTQRHELSCASCGAPLRQLKNLKSERGRCATGPAPVQVSGRASGRARAAASGPASPMAKAQRRLEKAARKAAKKQMKKRRSPARKAAKGLFDLLEDIFD